MEEKTILISDALVQKYVTLEDVIDCVEEVWKWHARNKVVMPPKVTTDMSQLGVNGWFNSMPAYLAPVDMAGVKVVGGYADNPSRGLPFICANILLTNPHNGFLRALVCGNWISDARTGAQPAIAMKYLAASTDVITIIGAGRQAFYAVECIRRVHHVKELRVCDIRPEAREKFAGYFPDAEFAIVSYESIEKACVDSDVIITLTTADAVLVEDSWCRKGSLVLTMGSFQEVSDDIARNSDKLFLDHIAQGLHRGQFKKMAERGEIKAEDFAAELTEVAAGLKAGRDNPDQRIMAQLVGMGSPDINVASLAYRRILQAGESLLKVDMQG